MSIQVANWTYAECIDGMLMILLSTLELKFFSFNPFYNKHIVNILEGSVLQYILFVLDTEYSKMGSMEAKTKSITRGLSNYNTICLCESFYLKQLVIVEVSKITFSPTVYII